MAHPFNKSKSHSKPATSSIARVLILAIMAMALIIGCGETQAESADTIPLTDYSAYISLPNYKGLYYTIPDDYQYTEADIKEIADNEEKRNFPDLVEEKSITDRGANADDEITVVYTAKYDKDDKPFEEGTSPDDGDTFIIGQSKWGTDFDNSLIGMKPGNTKEITIPVHIDADTEEPVTFSVSLNKITEYNMPELTDDIIKERTNYNTYAEYRSNLENSIRNDYETITRNVIMDDLLTQVTSSATVNGYPDGEINSLIDQGVKLLEQDAATSGVTTEEFLKTQMSSSGFKSIDDYREFLRTQAENYMALRMAATEIARKEGITITDSEINEIKSQIRDYYGLSDNDDISEYESDEDIQFEVMIQKLTPVLIEMSKPDNGSDIKTNK